MLEWDDLRVVLAITRHGSLTAAARALHVTQPTVGRRLEMLEARIGAHLFERTPAGPVPTRLGQAVAESAVRMEAAALQAERRIAARDTGLDGLIRITCLEWFGSGVLAPILAAFARRYPRVTVELLADRRLFNLSKREADLALRHVRFEQDDLVERKVADVAYALYASITYLERHGMPDVTGRGAGHAAVVLHQGHNDPTEVRWLLGEVLPAASVAVRSSSRDVQAQAAAAGAGVVLLPRCLGDAVPALRRLPPPWPTRTREVWLGFHQDLRGVERIRAFVDFAADALKQQAADLIEPAPEFLRNLPAVPK